MEWVTFYGLNILSLDKGDVITGMPKKAKHRKSCHLKIIPMRLIQA